LSLDTGASAYAILTEPSGCGFRFKSLLERRDKSYEPLNFSKSKEGAFPNPKGPVPGTAASKQLISLIVRIIIILN
jgi:hypothetical protein